MTEEDGVALTWADVNGLTVSELRFPPGYVQDAFEPELPYLALVLDGSLVKSFRTRTIDLRRACGLTMPAGATHGARFGAKGARIVVVKPRDASHPAADSLDRLVDLRGPGSVGSPGGSPESAPPTAAPLAAEGFALELVAGTRREAAAEAHVGRSPAWLRSAEELLRERIADCIGLSELADAVGVHPMHLARTFRARHGISVEYGRRLRVAWAASEIARRDTPLALIAAQAAADQSHFHASSSTTSARRPPGTERRRPDRATRR